MVEEQKSGKKSFSYVPVIAALLVVGFLAVAGGFSFAASRETHDEFCASCHTQPESTFYQRSTAPQAVDLASYHSDRFARCIDCHSGEGVPGRASAELMGARNALKWYTGTAVQPALLTVPVSDQNCLKCHQNVTEQGFFPREQITVLGSSGFQGGEREGRNNHWHALLARWQAASPAAGTCASCHGGHTTEGTAQSGFMRNVAVSEQCDACHSVLRHGEGGG